MHRPVAVAGAGFVVERLAELGEQRQGAQLLERAVGALHDLLLLRGPQVGQAGLDEAAGLAGRRRGQFQRAFEVAELLQGAGGDVGHADQQRYLRQLGQGFEQRQPQPLRGAHPRHLGGVEPQRRHAQAVVPAERLRHVKQQQQLPVRLAHRFEDHAGDVGLGVGLDRVGAGGSDPHQLRFDDVAIDPEFCRQPGERGGEIDAVEFEAHQPVCGTGGQFEGLLDVVGEQRLAGARPAADQQPWQLPVADAADEAAKRAPFLPTQELQHLLLGATAGRQQHLEFGGVERCVAVGGPQAVEDAEQHPLVAELPLVPVDDVAHHIRVGAVGGHLLAQPVDAAEHAVLVAGRADAAAHIFEDLPPGARVVAGRSRCHVVTCYPQRVNKYTGGEMPLELAGVVADAHADLTLVVVAPRQGRHHLR